MVKIELIFTLQHVMVGLFLKERGTSPGEHIYVSKVSYWEPANNHFQINKTLVFQFMILALNSV